MPPRTFGDRLALRNGPAWHNLGTDITKDPDRSASHGLRIARVDYDVDMIPMFYMSKETGLWVSTPRMALVRPTHDGEPEAYLGEATDEYRVLQNIKLARMMDKLTEIWPLETVGALGQGEAVFMTLNTGSAEVGGDEITQYLFAYNKHDGMSTFRINITPVRVVCANTCATGLAQATVQAAVRHTVRVEEEAELAIDIVSQLRRGQDEVISGLDRLTKVRISYEQIKRVLEAVYPEKEENDKTRLLEKHDAKIVVLSDEQVAELMKAKIDLERGRRNAQVLQLAALERFQVFNDENSKYANTGWALYNAVTETESWREGGSQESLVRSLTSGERGKNIATAFQGLTVIAMESGV